VNKVRATVGLGTVTLLLIGGWLVVRSTEPPAGAAEPAPLGVHRALPRDSSNAIGSAGCSGIACHGGPVVGLMPTSVWGTAAVDRERWRSSATVWTCYDPHARAFAVLANDRSKQIERLLTHFGEKPLEATTDTRCLACHTNPALAAHTSSPLIAEGVGCEACHGNARSWVGEHAGWAAGPGYAAKAAAMTRLSDVTVRAETCAGCHVGAPAGGGTPMRDMNHDLIAAGHPRLNFDYATFLRALPPHWTEKDRETSPPTLRPASDEFRHWLVGRAVTAAATLRLRADREKRGPWPELAEFDCYACHHGLRGGVGSGRLVRNDPPFADAFGIPKESRQSVAAWDQLAERFAADPMQPSELTVKLANVKPQRWDEACQLYYALLAIERARGKVDDPRLAELRSALRLPRESDGVRFNSPIGFEPGKLPFAELFRELSR
jgi:hypothetical protein